MEGKGINIVTRPVLTLPSFINGVWLRSHLMRFRLEMFQLSEPGQLSIKIKSRLMT
jgi:hypothetical protein